MLSAEDISLTFMTAENVDNVWLRQLIEIAKPLHRRARLFIWNAHDQQAIP